LQSAIGKIATSNQKDLGLVQLQLPDLSARSKPSLLGHLDLGLGHLSVKRRSSEVEVEQEHHH
jgi:hypothetical protein